MNILCRHTICLHEIARFFEVVIKGAELLIRNAGGF